MVQYDFHNKDSVTVSSEVHAIVGRIRQRGGSEEVEFITGRGVHRDHVMSILTDYNLLPTFKLGNDGVIVVTIE